MHTVTSRNRWLTLTMVLMLAILAVTGLALIRAAHAASINEPAHDPPGPDLHMSYKSASKNFAVPGDVLTYTIQLRNTGMGDAIATVVDPIPHDMTLVAGSVSYGGMYDAGTHTITWSSITVTMGSDVPLEFAVTAGNVTWPIIVTNRASITTTSQLLDRSVSIMLFPTSSTVSNLYPSHKDVSRHVVSAGEAITYTITLINVGPITATANVTDPVPGQLNYVAGSVTGGGAYDQSTHTLSWNDVLVPPSGHAALTFVATATQVASPTLVFNTATISSSNVTFDRSTPIVILPHSVPPPHSNLTGSFKMASKRILAPHDVLTYTINLINSGNMDALVDVADPVPTPLNYAPDSASDGGIYDQNARILTWSAITVPAASNVSVSFAVTAAVNVTRPMPVMNTATISVTGDGSFHRSALVWLVPLSNGDVIPPVVHSLTIDDQDVLTSPTVTLHISATDNVSVSLMNLREWELTTHPFPHWSVVQSTGWITYEADYPWTLRPDSGTHFIGVWVADEAHNVSHIDRRSIDFASLLLPDETVPRHGVVPYLVYYNAGVNVTATLTPSSGDADLYVWYPGGFFLPDQSSTLPLTSIEVVTFTTPRAGAYLFIVHGYTDATYNLSIEPGGGPRPWPSPMSAPEVNSAIPNAPTAKPDGLLVEPVLSQSGVDPLGDSPLPAGFYSIYLPITVR